MNPLLDRQRRPLAADFASPETFEAALLDQQRRGYRRLRFVEPLEVAYQDHAAAVMRRRLPLIISAGVVMQSAYALLDLWRMPPALASEMLALRGVALLVTLLCYLYCRRPEAPASHALACYGLAYAVNGLCVALLILPGARHGVDMPYEGLFLLLLFGYGVLGLSLRVASAASWLFSGVLVVLGYWLGKPSGVLLDQLLFLGCANLIGGVGSYIQERGQRGAWLNARLLEQARQRAEAQTLSRGRLLAAVSHDLRQPLHAMALYAEQLGEGRVAEPSRVQDIGQRLAQSVGQLGGMLQALLDYSRLSVPGGLSVRRSHFDLLPLLQRLLDEAGGQARSQNCQLELQASPCWVYSDALLVERIVRNLLSNALQHAGAQHIRLHCRQQGEQCWLSISDDGRGLSKDEQQRVFEEFQQLHNPGRQREQGLGLGLAIVRQLSLLLELPLSLQASPGQGCTFTLQLPLGEAQSPMVTEVPVAEMGRVLLIEDDAASRQALGELLQCWGWEVSLADGPQQAQAQMRLMCPDVLLSDYRLAADIDGLRLLEQLREQAGSMLPAILLTADLGPELAERCARQHVRLLGKPLLPLRLRQALTASRAVAQP